MSSIRLAAIDIGSNAVRLLIGQISSDGNIIVLFEAREVLRLGDDTFQFGMLRPLTVQRLLETLARFKEYMAVHAVDHYSAVATSAIRSAQNGRLVIALLQRRGFEVEIIDGQLEARLELEAAQHAGHINSGWTIMLGIGAGSVEIVGVIDGWPEHIASAERTGTVWWLNFMRQRKLRETQLAPLMQRSQRLSEALPKKPSAYGIAVGGNPRAIGKIKTQLMGGSSKVITRQELAAVAAYLSHQTVEARQAQFALKPRRADIVAIAALLLNFLASRIGIQQVALPDVGLRHGLLLRTARD